MLDHCHELAESIETFEAEIVAHARHDKTGHRLATIPGVGPITASLIAATVADIGVFKSARQFAAWLGLVPRQHSTGGKTRLGRITKAGNREIRTLERRPTRLATVALANKMARIAWALMTRKEVYHAAGRIIASAEAAA